MDTFTVKSYSKETQIVTLDVTLAPRPGFAGETITGLKRKNPPTDSVDSVKAWLRGYADAYIAGKTQEEAVKVDISDDVKALLNKATSF